MRRAVVLTVLILALTLSGAPAKKKGTPAALAPPEFPHSIAMFLGSLSNNGAKQVTFKATAVGMRFFFEEPTGVTVYRYDRGRYVKEEFVRSETLTRVVKRYAKK